MKNYMMILAALLLMVAASACCHEKTSETKDALEVIKARTSIRSYTGEKLTDEQIQTLLEAAMAAPTDADIRPWHFVVLTDDEMKAGLYQGEHHKKMVADAGAIIIVCGKTTRLSRPHGNQTQGDQPEAQPVEVPNIYWFEDCSAATENLLLAATALDLGAVWLSCYPNERIVERIRTYLGLPADITPLAIVSVGVPAEKPEPKQKWDPTRIHYNKW